MRKAVKDVPGVSVVECASKYPMGGERQLIPAVLGRAVPSAPKGLPLDVGVVVINVATAHSIARAVCRDRPLTHRVVSVTGRGVEKPGNYLVPFGTSFADLITNGCGGVKSGAVKVIAGGPMMGPCVPHLNMPVVKGTGGYHRDAERGDGSLAGDPLHPLRALRRQLPAVFVADQDCSRGQAPCIRRGGRLRHDGLLRVRLLLVRLSGPDSVTAVHPRWQASVADYSGGKTENIQLGITKSARSSQDAARSAK